MVSHETIRQSIVKGANVMGLKNKKSYCMDESKIVFEQYKLYVEMADRISQRRMGANTFFISVNTLLFTATALLENAPIFWKALIGFLGCVLCFAWFFILDSYRQLNAGKFKVIHEIEKLLPLSSYAYEWEVLSEGEGKGKYWPLSHVEKIVPVVFFFAYIAFIAYQLLG